MCFAKNYGTSHQGAIVKVKRGDLVFSKNPTTVFGEPRINASFLSDGLMEEWMTKVLTLDDWESMFRSAIAAGEEESEVTAAGMEVQQDFAAKADAYRTPKTKRKRQSLEVPAAIGISPYKRQSRGEEDFVGLDAESTISLVVELVLGLDSGLDQTCSALVKLLKDFDESISGHDLTAKILEHRVETNKRLLGAKPNGLSQELDAPSAWGTLSAIASKMENMAGSSSDHRVKELALQAANGIKQKCLDKCSTIDDRLDDLKESLIGATTILKNALAADAVRIDHLENDRDRSEALKMTGAEDVTDSGTKPPPEWAEDIITRFQLKVDTMSDRLNRLSADANKDCIRFGGLGFDCLGKAASWLAENVPDHAFGLILDPHTVMANIQASIIGEPCLPKMERLYKLKLSTIGEALAMTSFENKIPSYLSSGSHHKVVRMDESNFNCVSNWSDWDEAESGFRAKLDEELIVFKVSHQESIDEAYESGTRAYNLAVLALTESISFIEGFMKFIDDYMKHLTQAKFGVKKAFHVTTRLAKGMWIALAEPRNGVMKTFQAGNLPQIGSAIFWANLRSLDRAMSIKKNGFKNDPIVSGELVKFLAVNTGIETIEVLKTKVKDLQGELGQAKANAAASAKADTSASNKADENKTHLEAFKKRLEKFEKG